MALTISIEGKGVIANADAISDTAGGTWSEQGGGTISVSNDVFLIGSASIGGKYAGKSGFHQYDIGAGSELDFTAGTGTESGQCFYIWVSMTALGTLDTLSTYPLCVRLSSDSPGTSNYIDYLIAGNDDKNGWDGGFRCFVIDPTVTPSRVSGTQSSIIAAVRTMGIWIDCSTSARADSIFTDQLAVGSGIRVSGTSTTGWQDITDYCTDYSLRGWGMFQEREGIIYTYGKTYIGDSVSQSANVDFSDYGKTIQYGFTEYCTNAAIGTWGSTTSTGFGGLYIEDHTSYTTTFNDGIAVDTDNGRAGSSFIGNPLMNVTADLYGGNNTGSVSTLYNTQLKNLTGGIIWGDSADHKYFGGIITGSGQFDPVGAVQLRNLIISGYIGTTGALLWNANIDIAGVSFIANTDAVNDTPAIQHTTNTTATYDNLIFSGNDFDINNSSGATLIVAKINDSDPSTYTGSLVTFTAPFNSSFVLSFSQNLVDEEITTPGSTLYRMYFTNDDEGDNTGRDFNTANAMVVNDKDGIPITGTVDSGTIAFEYAFDSNAQRGASSVNTIVPIIVAYQGLSDATINATEFFITRSTGVITFLCDATDEFNYSNPT